MNLVFPGPGRPYMSAVTDRPLPGFSEPAHGSSLRYRGNALAREGMCVRRSLSNLSSNAKE